MSEHILLTFSSKRATIVVRALGSRSSGIGNVVLCAIGRSHKEAVEVCLNELTDSSTRPEYHPLSTFTTINRANCKVNGIGKLAITL